MVVAKIAEWIKTQTVAVLITSGILAGVLGWSYYAVQQSHYGYQADIMHGLLAGQDYNVSDWDKQRDGFIKAYMAMKHADVVRSGLYGLGGTLIVIGLVVMFKDRRREKATGEER